jgi:hypothetical protein
MDWSNLFLDQASSEPRWVYTLPNHLGSPGLTLTIVITRARILLLSILGASRNFRICSTYLSPWMEHDSNFTIATSGFILNHPNTLAISGLYHCKRFRP